jgi:hypothetical protein
LKSSVLIPRGVFSEGYVRCLGHAIRRQAHTRGIQQGKRDEKVQNPRTGSPPSHDMGRTVGQTFPQSKSPARVAEPFCCVHQKYWGRDALVALLQPIHFLLDLAVLVPGDCGSCRVSMLASCQPRPERTVHQAPSLPPRRPFSPHLIWERERCRTQKGTSISSPTSSMQHGFFEHGRAVSPLKPRSPPGFPADVLPPAPGTDSHMPRLFR